jgi:hypothetical protein
MPTIALLHMQRCQPSRRKQVFADLGRASGTDETQHSVAVDGGRLLPLVAKWRARHRAGLDRTLAQHRGFARSRTDADARSWARLSGLGGLSGGVKKIHG